MHDFQWVIQTRTGQSPLSTQGSADWTIPCPSQPQLGGRFPLSPTAAAGRQKHPTGMDAGHSLTTLEQPSLPTSDTRSQNHSGTVPITPRTIHHATISTPISLRPDRPQRQRDAIRSTLRDQWMPLRQLSPPSIQAQPAQIQHHSAQNSKLLSTPQRHAIWHAMVERGKCQSRSCRPTFNLAFREARVPAYVVRMFSSRSSDDGTRHGRPCKLRKYRYVTSSQPWPRDRRPELHYTPGPHWQWMWERQTHPPENHQRHRLRNTCQQKDPQQRHRRQTQHAPAHSGKRKVRHPSKVTQIQFQGPLMRNLTTPDGQNASCPLKTLRNVRTYAPMVFIVHVIRKVSQPVDIIVTAKLLQVTKCGSSDMGGHMPLM